MPGEDGFQGELAAALEKKAAVLAAEVLPALKEGFKLFHSLFNNLYNLLYRKSLIQEDPYQHERKLSELSLPSREPIPDSERLEKLSRRLAEYQAQLEFLGSTYQFSLEFLDLKRLKLLADLVRFIDWSSLGSSSPDANTAALAEALGRIKLGADKVSAGIVADSSAQLAGLARRLQAGLQELAVWQREAWKLELRRRLPAGAWKLGSAEALPGLQRAWRQLAPGRPFYQGLAQEALAEEADGPGLRAGVLARLAVEARRAPQAPPVDYRGLLLEAVRLLLPLAGNLGEALTRLETNRRRQEGRRKGWRGRLRALLAGVRDPGAVLEVRLFDDATGVARLTRVDLPQFLERLRRKKALLESLASSTSAASARLRAAPERELAEFLERNLAELGGMLRVMQGLDAWFKAGGAEEVRGIKLELAAIKNGLVRANKQRYEYVARRQEQQQRQEMGLG